MRLSDLLIGCTNEEVSVNMIKGLASRVDELEDLAKNLREERDKYSGMLRKLGERMELNKGSTYKCIHVSSIFSDDELYGELIDLLELRKEEEDGDIT